MTRRISGYDIAKRQTSAALRDLVQSDAAAETKIHCAIVELIEAAKVPGVIYWHTPNGMKRSKKDAAILKAMGVLAGVVDLIISQPGGVMRYLELKTRRGIVSKEQTAFMSAMEANGHDTAVVRSLEEAARVLEGWGVIRGARVAA